MTPSKKRPRARATGPAPPEGLGKRAGELWREYRARLLAPTQKQLELLAAFSTEKARWLDCLEYLEREGVTVLIRTDRGELKGVVEAPQVKIAERARQAMLELAAQLDLREPER